MSKLRLARFATLPVLGAALTLACSESPMGTASPTGTALDRPTPIQSSVSAGPWVAKVSGGLGGFENGTGFPIPFGQKNDINTAQVNAKLFGDGSASGSATTKRQLVKPDPIFGVNEILIFQIIKSSVTCLEVDGNQAWIGIEIEKSASEVPPGDGGNPFPPGTEAVQQFVLQPDGTVLSQIAPMTPASLCVSKPDLSVGPGGFFRFDNGHLTITDRR